MSANVSLQKLAAALVFLLSLASCDPQPAHINRVPKKWCEPYHQVTGTISWNLDWQHMPDDNGFQLEYRAWVLARTGYLVWAASAGSSGNCLAREFTKAERMNPKILEEVIRKAPPCGSLSGWSATREENPQRTFDNWMGRLEGQFEQFKQIESMPIAEAWLGRVGLIQVLQCST